MGLFSGKSGLPDSVINIDNIYHFSEVTLSSIPDWEGDQVRRHFLDCAYLTKRHSMNEKIDPNFPKYNLDKKIEKIYEEFNIKNNIDSDIFEDIHQYFSSQGVGFNYEFYYSVNNTRENLASRELQIMYEISKNEINNSFFPVSMFNIVDLDNFSIHKPNVDKINKIVNKVFSEDLESYNLNIKSNNDVIHFANFCINLSEKHKFDRDSLLSTFVDKSRATYLNDKLSDPDMSVGMAINLHNYLLDLDNKRDQGIRDKIDFKHDNLLSIKEEIKRAVSIIPELFDIEEYIHPLSKEIRLVFNSFNSIHEEKIKSIKDIDFLVLNQINQKMKTIDNESFKNIQLSNITGFDIIDKFIHSNQNMMLANIYGVLNRSTSKSEMNLYMTEMNKNYHHFKGKESVLGDFAYQAIQNKVMELVPTMNKKLSNKLIEVFLDSNNQEDFIQKIELNLEVKDEIKKINNVSKIKQK